MSTDRTFLIETLSRVIKGGEVTHEQLEAGIADVNALGRYERRALEQLTHWADDFDIRENDAAYGEMKRDWLRDCLAALEALAAGFLPSEVDLGEHQGTRISFWGCLLAVAGLALAFYLMFITALSCTATDDAYR